MENAVAKDETYGIALNEDVCFSNMKKVFKKGIKKGQLTLLKPVAPVVKQFLEPEEEVLFLTKGCSPMSTLEQLTTGWIIMYINRCVLVVTNKRILHIPTKSDFKPKQSTAEIVYGDIEKYKISSFLGGKLDLTYKSGKKERFAYLQGREMKKLQNMLPSLSEGSAGTSARGRNHLCPRCRTPLQEGNYECPNCRLRFKSKKDALKYSLLFPGGGYFYTGHPFMGAGDALGETFLLVIFIVFLVDALTGKAQPADIGLLIFFGILLILEKTISCYHATHHVKEYLPIEFDGTTQPS
jgi:hypothetical protein